jgi:hypothetical protein
MAAGPRAAGAQGRGALLKITQLCRTGGQNEQAQGRALEPGPEYAAAYEKVCSLFREVDKDGSGMLDRNKIMGLCRELKLDVQEAGPLRCMPNPCLATVVILSLALHYRKTRTSS